MAVTSGQASTSTWDTSSDVALFRAISIYRPVGEHRHFHMISILQSLEAARESQSLPIDTPLHASDVWSKLEEFYELHGLNELDEGSDEEDGPEWISQYNEHVARLQRSEKARTRYVAGLDEEEFSLHPYMDFDDLLTSRRTEDAESEESGKTKQSAQEVVPPSSDDDLAQSDSDADMDTATEDDKGSLSNRGASTTLRRNTRKRAHTETDTTLHSPKDDGQGPHTRAGKRRRGAKADDEVQETPTRPLTRRQQKQLEDHDKKKDSSGGDDMSDAAAEDTPSTGLRSTRSTPLRRAASSLTKASANTSLQASPAPTPTRSTRPRRL
ncbi:esa1-associated factor [Malassezia pachydermatis]|uniref:Mrg-binding protein n=1 Tax=Malassezia pachydermatis TaxID=77020 RepID=A0A0M8MXS6_9BASI|nr:mrg-binding protein [Malassezia pachydermatis]KOS16484.1 mrg-binding protein [Malassezia pachydermatis]